MRLSRIIFIVLILLILEINVFCLIFEGQIPSAFFNYKGELNYIYKSSNGKILLENAVTKEIFVLPLNENVFSPLVKKDRNGNLWLVWEEWSKNHSKIFIGRLKEDGTISICNTINEKGFNYSPDLFFDENNIPWLTWVNWSNSHFRSFISNTSSGKKWIVNSIPFISISSSKIIVSNNQILVFWSGSYSGPENIYFKKLGFNDYHYFNYFNTIDDINLYPNLNPQVAIDKDGLIWMVWSGYDGHDYEIYCSIQYGDRVLRKIKITDNSENDVSPSLLILENRTPVISWCKTSKWGSDIYVKFFEGDNWSEEIRISFGGNNYFPQIICHAGKIALIWNSLNEIKTKVFYLDNLKIFNNLSTHYRTQFIYNPLLQENIYIGFGNSITYGYINHEPFPEKGYIPRLKNMLNISFGETEVLNEGYPGELTENGLSRIDGVIENDSARYLLLMEGTNDVIFNQISMDTSAFNLREMVKKCIEYGVFPSIATILPRNDWAWYFDFFRKRIFYLNDKIREIANEFSIPLTDQFNAFFNYPKEKGGWKSLLSEDGKHPNEKGYQVMAEEWFKEIKKFPFPPINFNVKRVINEILFYKEEINRLEWNDSPKINMDYLEGYKIYRKRKGEENYNLIAIVRKRNEYLDKDINPNEKYSYLISTLRNDGVEGPCVGPVKDY